jgi:hypothetical protein
MQEKRGEQSERIGRKWKEMAPGGLRAEQRCLFLIECRRDFKSDGISE